VPAEKVGKRFGWVTRFFAFDGLGSTALVRELLNWQSTHPG